MPASRGEGEGHASTQGEQADLEKAQVRRGRCTSEEDQEADEGSSPGRGRTAEAAGRTPHEAGPKNADEAGQDMQLLRAGTVSDLIRH